MALIKVLVKEPGKAPEVREIENTLKSFQELVGGSIEAVHMDNSIHFYINEEGKILNLKPNFVVMLGMIFDIVVGTAVFARSNDEGEETDLTDKDITFLKEFLNIVSDYRLQTGKRSKVTLKNCSPF